MQNIDPPEIVAQRLVKLAETGQLTAVEHETILMADATIRHLQGSIRGAYRKIDGFQKQLSEDAAPKPDESLPLIAILTSEILTINTSLQSKFNSDAKTASSISQLSDKIDGLMEAFTKVSTTFNSRSDTIEQSVHSIKFDKLELSNRIAKARDRKVIPNLKNTVAKKK